MRQIALARMYLATGDILDARPSANRGVLMRRNRQTLNEAEWVRRATLRLRERNLELSTWDAVAIVAAVAQRGPWTYTGPEAAIDKPFGDAEPVANLDSRQPGNKRARDRRPQK